MQQRIFVALVLLVTVLVIPGKATVELLEDTDNKDSSGSCESSPSFWGDSGSSSNCQNNAEDNNNSVSLRDFLQMAVFGQGGDEPRSSVSDKDNKNDFDQFPFLSFLDNRRKERPLLSFLEGNSKNDNESSQVNPFFSFLETMQQTRAMILGETKDDTSVSTTPNETILANVLEKARHLAQQDEEANAITAAEFVSVMKNALQKVTKQLQDNFGDLISTNIDAFMALAIPYYCMAQDSKHSPLAKRKLHRFYQKVTKDEWIDLHDALYLSQLAYVDTIEQFEEGLEKFDGNSWTKLYGTTKSMPDLPASFLLIHKELDPLVLKPNKKRHKQNSPLEAIQESLQNMGKPSQSEVVVTLVVRGTKHIADFLQDGLLEPEEYRGGYAHSGILASGKNLAKQYLPKLKDLHDITQRDKIRVILIGHSLGAGAAAIAAMELREHDFLEVEAVGFGCPSLLSKDLSQATKDYITTVVNDADIVSRMSGASMTNVLLDLLDYDWTQDALEDLEYSLERARESFEFAGFLPETNKALEWFETRLNEVVRPHLVQRKSSQQGRLPSVLIPPGTCIHIFRDGYGMTGTYTPCDFFQSVEFSLTLLDDHLILTGYNRALLAAAQDIDRDYSVSTILYYYELLVKFCCIAAFLPKVLFSL